MPSTTPNYGWTYPISSDDLNAGATSIGSLATEADASLKAEANARAAADTSLQNNLNAKISVDGGSTVTMKTGSDVVTTDSNGHIWPYGSSVATNTVYMGGEWSLYGVAPYVSNTNSNQVRFRWADTGVPAPNTTIRVTWIRWF